MRLLICAVMNALYSLLAVSGVLHERLPHLDPLPGAVFLAIWLAVEGFITVRCRKAAVPAERKEILTTRADTAEYENRISKLEGERSRLRDLLSEAQLKQQSLQEKLPQSRPSAGPQLKSELKIKEKALTAFLSLLQEQGRFIDFFLDDIGPYANEQIGAAARVVHQGCGAVLKSRVAVSPIYHGKEGDEVTLPVKFDAAEWRVVGRVSGGGPFKGKVLHRGWKIEKIHLPEMSDSAAEEENRVIMPAELDIE